MSGWKHWPDIVRVASRVRELTGARDSWSMDWIAQAAIAVDVLGETKLDFGIGFLMNFSRIGRYAISLHRDLGIHRRAILGHELGHFFLEERFAGRARLGFDLSWFDELAEARGSTAIEFACDAFGLALAVPPSYARRIGALREDPLDGMAVDDVVRAEFHRVSPEYYRLRLALASGTHAQILAAHEDANRALYARLKRPFPDSYNDAYKLKLAHALRGAPRVKAATTGRVASLEPMAAAAFDGVQHVERSTT